MEEVKQRTQGRTDLLRTSDEHAPYATAIKEAYHQLVPVAKRPGPGRPPKPKRVMPPELCYATVCKKRAHGRVVEIRRTLTTTTRRRYEFTGFERGQYGDQSWKPILHLDDVQRCVDTYYGCIRSGQFYQIEYRFKDRKSGGYRWFLGRAYPVRDERGGIVRWFGTCTDIDDTKRAEETARFLADASATLAELMDYESTLQRIAGFAVPHFADWCAVDMLEVDGSVRRLAVAHTDPAKVKLAHALFHRYPLLPTDAHGVMAVLRSGKPDWTPTISDELLATMTHDAEHLRILRELGLKSHICVPLNARTKTLGVLTFVTAESGRIYGAADVRAAEDLAHRAVIAIDNATLLAALKASDRKKDEFLAMLAHELRNPLAPIRNAVHILRAKGLPMPELQWARDVIDRQVQQLTRLVDDLLDVSRITKGKIELRKERVPLAAVVGSAVEASRPLIEKWGHELTITIAARTDLPGGRPDPPRPSPVEPPQQRSQVYRARRSHLADCRTGGRSGMDPREGHRHRHPARDAAPHLRDVHPGRSFPGTLTRRTWHRLDAGEDAGGDARWHGPGCQRRSRQGQ